MNNTVKVDLVQDDHDINQILALQALNLKQSISSEEADNQGFVTVQHSFDVLKDMNKVEPGTILKEDNNVIGYCLAMSRGFEDELPILANLFAKLDKLTYDNQLISHYNYIIVGQVCIAKEARGKGYFDKMYKGYKANLSSKYDFAITEVADENQRSLRAHYRVGFKTIEKYQNEIGKWWHVVLWDWRQ